MVALIGAGAVIVTAFALFGASTTLAIGLAPALVFYALAAGLTARAIARHYPHSRLGMCNVVTLIRLMMVAVMVNAVASGIAPSWTTFVFAGLALSLDGLDGWFARQEGLSSSFGARFDMEIDAAFALILALHAALSGADGPYIILLGLPHYAFSLAKFIWPWLGNALPDLFSRKVVCVAQLATLIALQIPVLVPSYVNPAVAFVVAALAWSFARDIIWLYGTRAQ